MPWTATLDTPSNVYSLEPSSFPSLEESETPRTVLSMSTSVSPSDDSTGNILDFSLALSTLMPSEINPG